MESFARSKKPRASISAPPGGEGGQSVAQKPDSREVGAFQVLAFDFFPSPRPGSEDFDLAAGKPAEKDPAPSRFWRSLVRIVGKNRLGMKTKSSSLSHEILAENLEPWSYPLVDLSEKKISGKKWTSTIKALLFGRSKKTKESPFDSSLNTSKESISPSAVCPGRSSGESSSTSYITADGFSSPNSDKPRSSSQQSSSTSTPNLMACKETCRVSRETSLIVARSISRLSCRHDRDDLLDTIESVPLLETPRSSAMSSPASSTTSSKRSSRISPRISPSRCHEKPMRRSSAVLERRMPSSPSAMKLRAAAANEKKNSPAPLGNVAIVKQSEDPFRDFQDSMIEMIKAKNIKGDRELVNLLNCYLSLNAPKLHPTIIDAFAKVCPH
ncbi:putative protein TPRXL [Selaginella moellendorffii]|uniref:putative protein TPRXL n=1 Tax=Selaginella moellendorffii TaxID=88036 RepID=UPI000D1D0370|nr:putative protein TPRXL [Selaginella moellendorffii]|eukprot:XP_024526737.1 putative protein TPRXL [Selaginella moellendorffii]